MGSLTHAIIGTSVSSILVIVITFISGVMIARVLGPDARGEYGTVMVIAQTITSLSLMSYFDGALILLCEDRKNRRLMLPSMILAAIGISVFGSLASFIFIPWIGYSVPELGTSGLFIFTSFLIVTQVFSDLFSALDRSAMDFRVFNLVRVITPALFTAPIIFIFFTQHGSLSVKGLLVIFVAAKLPGLFMWLWQNRQFIFGSISPIFIIEAGKLGLRLHISFAAAAVAGQLDRLLGIGSLSEATLGQYFVALSAVGAGYSVIVSALFTITMPYLAGTHVNERRERLTQMIRMSNIFTILVIGLGWVLLPILVLLFYGTKFKEASDMSQALLIALAPTSIKAIMTEAIRSLGAVRPTLIMSIVNSAVLAAGYFLTNYEAALDLIFAVGIGNVASMIVGGIYLSRRGEIGLDWLLLPTPRDIITLIKIIKKHST